MNDNKKTKTKTTTTRVLSNANNSSIGTASDAITKYITNINAMSSSTAKEYCFRLQHFARFTSGEYKMSVDNLVHQLMEGSQIPYDVLSNFISS